MPMSIARFAVLGALACGAASGIAQVTPPPLPPGSHLVRPEPGMSEPERKRHVRAHHHKFHHKKDYTRDDSIHGHESQAVVRTGTQGSTGGPAARSPAVPIGGAGTGPAREKTHKGASSYFHGNKK